MWHIYKYIYIYIYTHTHTHAHTHDGVLLSHKKNKIMSSAATRMDIEIIILNEVNQKEKDKYHNIIYMWNLKKNDTNELTELIEKTHRHKTNYGYQRGEGGEGIS